MDANRGFTGNLSDNVGYLSSLDQFIKNCLMNEEQLKAESQLKKDLGPEFLFSNQIIF